MEEPKLVKLSVELPAQLRDEFHIAARRQGKTVSELMRHFIAIYVETRRREEDE